MNRSRRCGATNEGAPGTSNATARSRSTRREGEQVWQSSAGVVDGSVVDQINIVSEIIQEHQVLGAKLGSIRFIRVEISDQKIFFGGRLDYRGNQRVLREEKLALRAHFGRRVVGNIAEHGARRHGFSKHIEALFERGNSKVLRASGIDGDEIEQDPGTGCQRNDCEGNDGELVTYQVDQFSR